VESRLTAPVDGGNRDDVAAIARLFVRLGFTAFGGPAAHVALMETEVVTRRGWLTRAAFLDQHALVQVLPGPNSTELAIHIGHARAGWRGGLAAGLGFVLPSVVMVWGLMALTQAPALAVATREMLWWLVPVVVVVIADALWKFGTQAFRRPGAAVVMPLTALAVVLLPSDLLVLLVGAVLAVVIGTRRTGAAGGVAATLLVAASALGAQAARVLSAAPDPGAMLLYFLRAGVSVFGSGYVLLAYLQRDLVDRLGWLSMDTLLQASALAQLTPGPLFSTATGAGYAIGGPAGALAATIGIFGPAFASVVVGAPVRRLLVRSPVTRHALDGVVIASVSLLGRALAGFALPLEPRQWIIASVVAVLLFRIRVRATWLLVAAAAIGAAGAVLHLRSS
jgi:chromate transporter